ncbi:coiled-coil domain-containing protein 32 isoform X1 [Rousettus aegyptiacus]|uniref:Coiled-coil domain containing 32 n=1 Tax=Rousettus aegyptiacus TaxID=9407 RepID=A0A7J8IG17_ROUAE|nr:coiled-coil domain-containing protein 32 isoform X1 [Rousettus aegyptiacus]XP_036073624.1 coiled-coil domain-containing protein 32 isoform X1 [Rousettus aegyptiacus]XP_036073625.1 coiled-coil domain-containing protein 32 isoform X1 [Rousettus aegyptiacus]KAF6483504.1 coiled-coil domain containing 32 [Rousettus aegyptiacus]
MKMFESIDSTATKSGLDLWAEICSCLPNPDQEDGANNAFSDSFLDSYPPGTGQGETPDFAAQAALKPWAPLQDSEVYLASLEKKLRRIKGLNQELTSQDMLRTLAQAKKECWDRFLQEKLTSEFFVDGLDSDESTLEHFKRWLQPDKVAISTEEVQYLIPPESQVEKSVSGNEPAVVEQ